MTGWFARRSLRARLMTVGLAGVAGALLFGGLLLYAAMTTSLDRASVSEARASASDVASLVDAGRLPDPVLVSGALVVQVLDADNRVVGGSATADRLTSLVTPSERRELAAGSSLTVPGFRVGVSGSLRVVGVATGPTTSRVLVVAAVPTADLETSERVLRTLMLVFFPVFLLLLALIAWQVVGLALRPVEQLRLGAVRIGRSADPTERLPVLSAQDEISALATTLNDMLARLAAATASQRVFVADAAHELRSPLASLRTQLEVAERVGDGGDLPAGLLPEVERLSGLVEDLLVLARSGAEAGPPRREPVDLGVLVEDMVRRYAGARVPVRVATRQSAAPFWSRDDGAVVGRPDRQDRVDEAAPSETSAIVVQASPAELLRAVTNLVDNAVRHARSEVTLSASLTSTGARLVVRDDGLGIRPEDRELVFDRFIRLDEARDRDSGGSGLGLPITRELLRRNGARVRLEDARPGVLAVVDFGSA